MRVGSRAEAARCYMAGARLGDVGCVVRAAGLLMPVAAQPMLRRTFLSDRRWMAEAREWVQDAVRES